VKDLYTFALPYSMSLLLARAKGIPYGIGSQSIDYVAWPLSLVYRQLFKDAEFVYNRDTDSINYLRECGYEFRENAYRPDTTVFFHRSDEAYADEFMAKHGLERDRFAMFVPRRPAYIDGKPSDMISHAVSQQRFEHQLAQMKDFIEKVTASGMKMVIAHETRDTVKGGLARKYIWERLSPAAQANTIYLDHFWTPEEALGVYKRTALLASEEMHSMIMAIGNEVPILHCPFAECGRKRQMIRDMGLADRLVDIDEPNAGEQMFQVFKAVTADLPAERARLRKTAKWLEGLAAKTVDKVRAIVRSSH
jgi:polysaccharide pyruvyl transferase WcaK-like protein